MYKKSKYNIYFNTSTGEYVYNALSGSLIQLEAENVLDHCLDEDSDFEYKNTLIRKGFIVKEFLDEFGYIKQKTNDYIFNRHPENVSYTILTTRKCNFNCFYCFEHNNALEKEIDTENTANFILKEIKRNSAIKRIRITWFGGEPLLNESAITGITKKILPIIEEKGIKYTSSIISNGSLVSTGFLKENRISSIQITLDGNGEIGKKYKGISDDTQSKVYQNISDLIQDGEIKVSLRINCDKNNVFSVKLLLEDIEKKGIFDKAYVYLAPIYTGTDSDLSEEEFYLLQREFYEMIKRNGHKDLLRNQLHKPRFMSCGFMGNGSYVIDTDGTLKKCERDVGKKDREIGDIINGKYFNSIESHYQDEDILDICTKCEIYPICRGGCRSMRDAGKTTNCEYMKKHLMDLLYLIVD